MSEITYPRPPVTEAVFEFRFSDVLNDRDLQRLKSRFSSRFPSVEERKNISVEVQPDRIATSAVLAGFQMTAKDAASIVILQHNALTTVKPAPYITWEEMMETSKANYELFEKTVGRKLINRISSRFQNRIDIPSEQISGKDLFEFVRLGVTLPEEISPLIGPYSLACSFFEKTTGVKVFAQTSIADPGPVIDHVSIFLDIDAFIDENISSHKDVLWNAAPLLRRAKNAVFEQCITDETRRLFQ